MLHAKYHSSGHYSFQELFFYIFTCKCTSLCKLSDTTGVAIFNPMCMTYIAFVEVHWAVFNAKYLSSGHCSFTNELRKLKCIFPYKVI
jgi:hypothetical protein